MALQAVARPVIPVLTSLQDAPIGVLAQACTAPTENQWLVGQQPTVLAAGHVCSDLQLDPVNQVGLHGINQRLGDKVGATLAAPLRHRLPQTHL